MSHFKIFLIIFLLTIITLLGFVAFRLTMLQNNSSQSTQVTSNIKEVPTQCTRTEMLKNRPEFERALSLIKQRSSKTLAGGFDDVINCIVVIYKDIKNTSGAEGYFLFDDSVASANYLPIYVDNSYKEADDIVTSMLLVHEMTHAGHYLNKLQGNEISCVNSEVYAFIAQFFYANALNEGERESLNTRIVLTNFRQNSDQPQIRGLSDLSNMSIDSLDSCGNKGYDDCWGNAFKKRVTLMVTSNPYYQKQCNL